MRTLLVILALAALLLVLPSCMRTYVTDTMGTGLHKNAAMNCPVCLGAGFYRLGKNQVRCYHCKGVGLVMGWSRVRPADMVMEHSHALSDEELENPYD